MRPVIYPYKMGSGSARRLQQELSNLRCKRVRADGNYRPYSNHLIINWGNTNRPDWYIETSARMVLNEPVAVFITCNKLYAFRQLQLGEVSTPHITTNPTEVLDSLEVGGRRRLEWLARTSLTGHGGRGIVPIYSGEEYGVEGEVFPIAPLYVRYIKKIHEYRIHIFRNEVLDIQQKRKRREAEVNYQIRNHSNGWVYCREDINTPNDAVVGQALLAVRTLNLDFGAVDVIWNDYHQRAYVLEVNTAPGLFESTLRAYANKFRELCGRG